MLVPSHFWGGGYAWFQVPSRGYPQYQVYSGGGYMGGVGVLRVYQGWGTTGREWIYQRVGGQVRIQDLVKGGPQLLRPKVADVAKRSRTSEVSILRPGSRARLRALEAFGFLMLKYAFSHILESLFLLF